MHAFDLIIFDADGTLVDTETDVHISLNLALEALDLPLISIKTARKAIGPGPHDFLRYVLGEHNLHRGQEFREAFRPIYHEHCADHTAPFEGIIPLLEQLKKKRIKTAVATNKARKSTDYIFRKLGLDHFFDLIVARDEVKNPKPEPDMLFESCKKLAVAPHRTLMLGDTDNDILAARSAGIKSCLALWGYSHTMDELIQMADFAVHRPLELLHIIKNEITENV